MSQGWIDVTTQPSPLQPPTRRQETGLPRLLRAVFTVLLIGAAFFATRATAAPEWARARRARVTTINGLTTITQVGSTENIMDANGNPLTVDPDPYKIAIAPRNLGALKKGDILVSNIGNDVGTSIVKFAAAQGPGKLFNVNIGNDGVSKPSGLAFNRGKLFVANSKDSAVLVFNPDGTLLTKITDPLFNGPWGITVRSVPQEFFIRGGAERWRAFLEEEVDEHKPFRTFFVANKVDAKVLRVDVMPPAANPTFKVTEIAQFPVNAADFTKIDLVWVPFLQQGNKFLLDVVIAQDPVNNSIVALPNATNAQAAITPVTLFQGTPLNTPGGIALNPFNRDLLVVNLADNNLVELNLTNGTVVGVKTIDPVMVDNQGNGSALFGVRAIKDNQGNLKVFFTDDNTNTLNVFSVQ